MNRILNVHSLCLPLGQKLSRHPGKPPVRGLFHPRTFQLETTAPQNSKTCGHCTHTSSPRKSPGAGAGPSPLWSLRTVHCEWKVGSGEAAKAETPTGSQLKPGCHLAVWPRISYLTSLSCNVLVHQIRWMRAGEGDQHNKKVLSKSIVRIRGNMCCIHKMSTTRSQYKRDHHSCYAVVGAVDPQDEEL